MYQYLAQNWLDLKDADFHYNSLCFPSLPVFRDKSQGSPIKGEALTLLCMSLPLVLSLFKPAGVLEEMVTTKMDTSASKKKPAVMFKDVQFC